MATTSSFEVKTDITNIIDQVTTLDESVKAFPTTGGSWEQGKAIHNNIIILLSRIKKATNDTENVDPKPLPDSDGAEIESALKDLRAKVKATLPNIVANKGIIEKLPQGNGDKVKSHIRQDLNDLNINFASFGTAVVGVASPKYVDSFKQSRDELDSEFAKVIAEYA